MLWKIPESIKIYEALGAISDGRVEINGEEGIVHSSSRSKHYSVKYSKEENAIMANDNGSYWKGYLGYPSIAYLMTRGIITYNPEIAEALKGIKWKDINTKNNNNWKETITKVLTEIKNKEYSAERIIAEVEKILKQIKELKMYVLGRKTKPPAGY